MEIYSCMVYFLSKLDVFYSIFQNDFRDYPPLLREAVSLARKMQDPLIEYSQLCTPDDEILCLRYHPLQVIILLFTFYSIIK